MQFASICNRHTLGNCGGTPSLLPHTQKWLPNLGILRNLSERPAESLGSWNVESSTRDFTQFVWMSSCETCENWVVAHTCSLRPGNDGGSVSQAQQDRAPRAPKVHKNMYFSKKSLNTESQTPDFTDFVWRFTNYYRTWNPKFEILRSLSAFQIGRPDEKLGW